MAAAMTRESWTEYVQRITAGAPRREIAKAAGIDQSGLSRWMNSGVKPRAEKVVAFARGLRQSPVEALIAAGYLEPHEVSGVIEVAQSPSQMSDQELIAELTRRLAERHSGAKVDDITHRLSRPDDLGENGKDIL